MLSSLDDVIPVNLDAVPAELRSLTRWVLWKALPQDDDPVVLTKSPFSCRLPDQRASSTRPDTWSDFATAAAAYEARETNGAAGLMVALGEGLAGVDLDDAIDPATGLPTPEAQSIIDRMQSYTEVSVSGTGVRIFVRAPEASGKKFGPVEIYSKARFMTVTGKRIAGTPDTIEDRATQLASLREELEQVRRAGRRPAAGPSLDSTRLREMFPGVTALGVPDDVIVRRASEVCGERFDKLWSGDDSDYDSRSQADLALAGDLAFICGPGEEERVEELMRQSELGRPKWDRDDYLPRLTIPRAYEGREDFYNWEILPTFGRRHGRAVAAEMCGASAGVHQALQTATAVAPDAPADSSSSAEANPDSWRDRPTIVLGPETDAILAELECHLATTMFQRAGQLVHVVHSTDASRNAACRRRAGAPVIAAVPVEQVQRLMSRHIRFVGSAQSDRATADASGNQLAADGDEHGSRARKRRKLVQKPAPANLAHLFAKCGSWDNIPTLNGLMARPFMRPDGTIMREPGYDALSGYLLLDQDTPPLVVPEKPTEQDVANAVTVLRDLVSDFPFAGPEHFSAWLATLLTAAARPAIDGPVPMLWLDANRRGTGKSKLGRLIGVITAGGKPTELSWTGDEKEMESRIASLLNGGDNYAFFDNACGTIRNPILERFLTSYAFDYRRFHRQELVKLPNRTTLAITGNNMTLRGDLSRRVLRCRLMTALECPEARDGFQHDDIEGYAMSNQVKLLAATLTILRAHAVAGFAVCPVRITREDGTVLEMAARPVGSFNSWDRIVRHAVLRAGLADPMLTQTEAREEDEDDVKLEALLSAWHHRSPESAWTVNDLLEDVFGSGGGAEPTTGREMLARAIREITDTAPGRMPETRTLGYKLKDARDKMVGGFCLRRLKKSSAGVRYEIDCEDPICLNCRERRGHA